jgi:penicillin-binding protein 2
MLIFDQLRRSDRQLRWLAAGMLLGMSLLFAGLWHIQVMSSRKYAENLRDQSVRNVLIAAPRGKILDRNGKVLAENQPRYLVNLYLEDLRGQFTEEYTNHVRKAFIAEHPKTKLTTGIKAELNKQARYNVVSNIVWQVSSAVLPQPLIMDEKGFYRHYTESLALPLTILTNHTSQEVALFMERCARIPGVEMEVEPWRVYPNGPMAVHFMGFVRQDVIHSDEEGIAFEDKTPVLVGKNGLEATYDTELRGKPGVKSILVNNLGYRQREEVLYQPLAGKNLTLTLDIDVQKAAEQALLTAGPEKGPDVRGAAVAMDVRTGDILAMASSPTFDPNMFLEKVSREDYERLLDENLRPQLNRVFYGSYAPGSTFKIITGLAALDAGVLDPNRMFYNQGYYRVSARAKPIADTAPIGNYDFKEAFKHSCNTYFINYGLQAGLPRILDYGNQFGLGDRTGLVGRRMEVSGYFPEVGQRFKKDGAMWMEGDTANLCIGQGEITVTPLQMVVFTAAVANGGKVFRPRVVAKIDGGDADIEDKVFPPAEVVHEVKFNERNIEIVHRAMLADVAEKGGSGVDAFVSGFNVCGKTGTAQYMRTQAQGGGKGHITWFVSYAPFEAPRYAVVVMVEEGASGGKACAPKAGFIMKALQKMEMRPPVSVPNIAEGAR